MAKKGKRGRGEGGIEVLPSGSFRGTVCHTVGGERIYSRKTFKKKADLLEWMRSEAQQGVTKPAGTFAEWLDTWLGLHKSEVSGGAYRTDAGIVKRHLKLAASLCPIRIRDLTPLDCRLYLASLEDLTPSQRNHVGRTLRMICNAAEEMKVVSSSPMRKVKIAAAPEPEKVSLTPEELGRLLQAAEDRGYGVQFSLWADGGFRPGEFLGLQWGDLEGRWIHVRRSVDINTGELNPPKTKKSRRKIALSVRTALALEPLRGEKSAPIVPSPTGKHWWQGNFVDHVFDPIRAASITHATPYIMRHTMATLLLRAGVSLKTVSERLGHEDVAMTLRAYAHVLPGDQEAAAEAMGQFLEIPKRGENPSFPTLSPRPEKAQS